MHIASEYDPRQTTTRSSSCPATITVEVNICRLEDSKWSLEVVDQDRNSIVWDHEFETDDEAHAEFLRSVDAEGLDGVAQ